MWAIKRGLVIWCGHCISGMTLFITSVNSTEKLCIGHIYLYLLWIHYTLWHFSLTCQLRAIKLYPDNRTNNLKQCEYTSSLKSESCCFPVGLPTCAIIWEYFLLFILFLECSLFCIYLHSKCGKAHRREEWSVLTYINSQLGSSSVSDLIWQHLLKLMLYLSLLLLLEITLCDLPCLSVLSPALSCSGHFCSGEDSGWLCRPMTLPQAVQEGVLEEGRQKWFPFSSSSAAYLRAFIIYELLWSLRQRGEERHRALAAVLILSAETPLWSQGGMDVHIPLGSPWIFNPFWEGFIDSPVSNNQPVCLYVPNNSAAVLWASYPWPALEAWGCPCQLWVPWQSEAGCCFHWQK